MSTNLRPLALDEPITAYLRTDYPGIPASSTVDQALATIRERGLGEKIVYFYVIDEESRLVGILPTRRLLTAGLHERVAEIMVTRVVAIPDHFDVLGACELFVMHRLLALPVVDSERRIIGVVDIQLFTDEVFDLAERRRADAVFEEVGIRISELEDARPVRAFRLRIPWLFATIASGTLCAMLASLFEATLADSLVLAFFLTLVLGLGESVSMQSMALTIQSLAAARPSLTWFRRSALRELSVSLLLGATCGTSVGLLVVAWRGETLPALVIAGGILLSLISASCLGLSVPALLHALRLDPRISAGPVTLALTDLCTLALYFTVASLVL